MDDEQKKEVLVFADLVSSVALYEDMGDSAAKDLIVRLQAGLTELTTGNGGRVQEIIGDEVLSRFESTDSALSAVVAMQQYCERFSGSEIHSHKATGSKPQLRIGMHRGVLLEDNKRIFGDTVNTASRVSRYAQADQILLTSEVQLDASDYWQSQLLPFRSYQAKGKKEGIDLYILNWPGNDQTAVSLVESKTRLSTLSLVYRDQSFHFKHNESVVVGRAASADLVIDAEGVSRRHLRFDLHAQGITLTDLSTNGTWVEFATGHAIELLRQQIPLTDSGVISIGTPIEEAGDHIIKFSCNS